MTPTQKARDAAIHVSALHFQLLAASTPTVTRADSRNHITRAFTSWEALKRRMEELSELAPNCSSEGKAAAEVLREIAERSDQGTSVASLRGGQEPPFTQTEGH